VRVAAVQAAPVWLDAAATVSKAVSLIREAGRAGARLIAFPEVFVPGYPYWNWVLTPLEGSPWFRRLSEESVRVPGEHTLALGAAAAQVGATVVIGVNERHETSPGTLYNSNLVFGPDGTLLGRHRKLVPTWAEKLTWAGGDGSSLRLYDTVAGRLGTLACGENTNTLARFALLALGEQVHVANFPAFPFNENYDMAAAIALRAGAHSFEGKLFTVVSCSAMTAEILGDLGDTPERRKVLEGRPNALSGVFGPDGGAVGAPLIDEEGIVYADVDPEAGTEARQMHDIVGHYNRFDVFQLSVWGESLAPLRWAEDRLGRPGRKAAG
jgi:aliphatic nitrilase